MGVGWGGWGGGCAVGWLRPPRRGLAAGWFRPPALQRCRTTVPTLALLLALLHARTIETIYYRQSRLQLVFNLKLVCTSISNLQKSIAETAAELAHCGGRASRRATHQLPGRAVSPLCARRIAHGVYCRGRQVGGSLAGTGLSIRRAPRAFS